MAQQKDTCVKPWLLPSAPYKEIKISSNIQPKAITLLQNTTVYFFLNLFFKCLFMQYILITYFPFFQLPLDHPNTKPAPQESGIYSERE